MRTAFFGGSFNPPHIGHFLAAAWVLCSGEVEEVWMVPCYKHAFGKALLSYEHRLAMCRLGAEPLNPERVRISTIEEEMGGVSYTVETLRALHERYPERSFRLLVGNDILQETDAWKDFEVVKQLAPLLVVPRGGWQETLPSIPTVSSSEIRERIQRKQSLEGFVPKPLVEYLEQHQLLDFWQS